MKKTLPTWLKALLGFILGFSSWMVLFIILNEAGIVGIRWSQFPLVATLLSLPIIGFALMGWGFSRRVQIVLATWGALSLLMGFVAVPTPEQHAAQQEQQAQEELAKEQAAEEQRRKQRAEQVRLAAEKKATEEQARREKAHLAAEKKAAEEQARKEAAAKKRARPAKIATTLEWHQGGTLHQAKVAAWKQSVYRNKLATSADFIVSASKKTKQEIRQSGNLDSLKYLAGELVTCINTATEGIDNINHHSVSQYGAMCLILIRKK